MISNDDRDQIISRLQDQITELQRRMERRRRRPGARLLGVAASVVLALAVAGVAYASIPGPDGAIHGCYAKNGNFSVVDSTQKCASNQTSLTWNQTGPAGPQGQQGQQGPAGPAGSTGPQGPAGIAVGYSAQLPGGSTASLSPFPGTIVAETAAVQAGTYYVSGSVDVFNSSGDNNFVSCWTTDPTGTDLTFGAFRTDIPVEFDATVSVTGVVMANAGDTIQMKCQDGSGESARAYSAVLTATLIGGAN
jgi:hypothetical protein